MMKARIISQIPGTESFYKELHALFRNKNYNSFKAMVSYLSWSGLKFLYRDIESFYDRNKKNVKMIVGIGNDASEVDVLRYLKERMPQGYFRIFNASNERYIFHPKIYIFSSDIETTVVIGSNNFTEGGLYLNSECAVSLTFNKSNKEMESMVKNLWDTYTSPKLPFEKGNLMPISKDMLKRAMQQKKSLEVLKKESKQSKVVKTLFSAITIPKPNKSDIYVIEKEEKKDFPIRKSPKGKKQLLLEVLKETGEGGTQIQIPSIVVQEYFKAKENHKTIQIRINKGNIRPAVICSFSNHTFRMSFPEIFNEKRPLLLRFTKEAKDEYYLEILKNKNYDSIIKKCTNKTRQGSKRWEIM